MDVAEMCDMAGEGRLPVTGCRSAQRFGNAEEFPASL
jgi:hypothetical protein